MRTPSFLFALIPFSLANPALAQSDSAQDDGVHGVVAIGAGLVPVYEGADSYRAIPFGVASLHYRNLSIDVQGLRARANLIPSAVVRAGPALNVRLSRGDSAGGRVALLNPIDTAIEVGGFVGVSVGGHRGEPGEVSFDVTALADVSGTHDGFLVTASLGYAAIRTERFSLSVDTQATYGSKDYLRTYFGVTTPEAARSGLVAYTPDASLRDIGVGTTIGYQLDDRWGLIGRMSYGRLFGDAEKSPIVRDEGSRSQGIAGLAISYRF